MTARAYSYLRFSTPEQSKGDSFRRQTESAVRYAALHGLELDETLTLRDQGVSGFRGANVRNGALGQFLNAIDEGHVLPGSFLLVESLDRVSRQNAWDALPVFQQIINSGVVIVTLFDGKRYEREDMRANPLKILESLFVMVRAHEESETKSRRGKAVWEAKRRRAPSTLISRQLPGWLRMRGDKVEAVPDRVAVIQRIVAMTLAGKGQHFITKTLNVERVPTFGKGANRAPHWNRAYVGKILNSPALIGTFIPKETIYDELGRRQRKPLAPIPNYFPAVIAEEEWHHLVALAAGGKRPPLGHKFPMRNLLAGLGRCPLCGSLMERARIGRRGNRPTLVCSRASVGGACTVHRVNAVEVERTIRQSIPALVEGAPAFVEEPGDQLAAVRNQLSELGQGRERLMQTIISAGSTDALNKALINLQKQERACETRLVDLARMSSVAFRPLLMKRLEEMRAAADETPENLNIRLRSVFEAVVVDFRRNQLEFRWRDHKGVKTSVPFSPA